RLRNNGYDVPRSSVALSSRNNNADAAEINCLLQFGQRSGLPPAKARTEITQPTKQIVGALLVDSFFIEGLDLSTLPQLLNCTRRPPNSRQVHVGQETVIMRVDVTEGRAAAGRLVTLVRRFIDGEPVDDRRQLSAALGCGLRIALRLAGFVQRIWSGGINAARNYSRPARHVN